MRVVWLLLAAAGLVAANQSPQLFGACVSDTDCALMAGVCGDGYCVCPDGALLDSAVYRCTARSVPDVVNRTRALRLAEHEFAVVDVEVADALPLLPSLWIIDRVSSHAQSTDGRAVIETSRLDLVSDDSREVFIPLADLRWQCAAGYKAQPVPVPRALQPLSVAPVALPGERCLSCAESCGLHGHGVCLEDACVCDDFYTGDYCEQPPADFQVEFGVDDFVGACSADSDCSGEYVCWFDAAALDAEGKCGCPPYEVESGDACGPLPDAEWYPGVLVDMELVRNVSYSTTLHAGFVDDTYAVHYSPMVMPASNQTATRFGTVYIHCKDEPRVGNTTSVDVFCGGVVQAHVDTNATTDASALVCAAGWACAACDCCAEDHTGPFCEADLPSCRDTYCSGHGECVDAQPFCTCDAGYYGPTCADARDTCHDAVCGSTAVNASCQLDGSGQPGEFCACVAGQHGAYCNQTEAQCAVLRCGGRGLCVHGDLQRCTCPVWAQSDPFCSEITCLNNGTLDGETCTCPPWATGDYCEYARCGWGVWDAEALDCSCDGLTVAYDTATHNCTHSLCGVYGAPISANACVCTGARTDRGNVALEAGAPWRCLTDAEWAALFAVPIVEPPRPSSPVIPSDWSYVLSTAGVVVGCVLLGAIFMQWRKHREHANEYSYVDGEGSD